MSCHGVGTIPWLLALLAMSVLLLLSRLFVLLLETMAYLDGVLYLPTCIFTAWMDGIIGMAKLAFSFSASRGTDHVVRGLTEPTPEEYRK